MGDVTCLELDCNNTPLSRGWCNKHYLARRNAGLLAALTPLQRFWKQIDTSGECWIWTGKTRPDGYARIGVDRGHMPVHRFAYEAFVGPIPDDMHVDHLCRTRACARPDHLEVVTQAENNRRAVAVRKPTEPKAECPHGHPMSGENLAVNTVGKRSCRECARIRGRKNYWRNKAA